MSLEEHYNHVARHPPQQHEVMRQGHNAVKKHIISRALQCMVRSISDCCVTDLACGRGGDLNKVRHCAQYTGVDMAGDALAELRRRAQELALPAVSLHHCEATQLPDLSVPQHLVLCNFALHYFCDTAEHAGRLLDTVQRIIAPSGMFCGTIEQAGATQFGIPHHAVVGDCVNAVEWRVPWHKIQKMAHQRGLALVFYRAFHHIDQRSMRNIYGFIMQSTQPSRAQSSGTQGSASATLGIPARRPSTAQG